MKRFLLSNPYNQRWVDAQEKRRKGQANAEGIARLVRREMFPQLHLQSLQPMLSTNSMSSQSSIPREIVMEAFQRQLHCRLMKELLKTVQQFDTCVQQTAGFYRTMTWEFRGLKRPLKRWTQTYHHSPKLLKPLKHMVKI